MVLVRKLIPFFGSPWETKHNIDCSNLYFPEKYDGLSESVAFAQNWGILQTRIDQRGDHKKINFDRFQIQRWILQLEQKK